MPTQDQVVWASVNLAKAGGDTESYLRGTLLPPATDPDEAAARNLLRIGGAIRTVEVVYTQEELASHALAHAERNAERVSLLDVDPSLPLGQQMPGGVKPGPPTMESPGATPVVIGHEPEPASPEAAGTGKPAGQAGASGPPGAAAAKPVPKTAPAASTGAAKAKG